VLEKTKTYWLYIISALFLAAHAYLLVRDLYWALLLPFAVILVWLYLYKMDWVLFLIAFTTPIAINMRDQDFGVGISLPTEPLLLGVVVVFLMRLLYENNYDKNVLRHPVTIIIILDLVWMLITSLTSDIPVVSFKYLAARLWFVIPFFFLGVILFKQIKNVKLFVWLYAIPLLGIIAYTTYNHYLWGFNEDAGHWVMEPFYNDHTAYGAIISLFIPPLFGFTFFGGYTRTYRLFAAVVLAILLIALVLSFSRAAWMSLAFAVVVYFTILLKIKFKWIVLTLVFFLGFFFTFQNEIWDRLEKNKQGSSANFVEHLQSISNISTDDSNLERINRWQSALRMFAERPIFGFGPGTYQFEYAPFQHSKEKTMISTNFGDKGNAHSEYIGPLAETGIFGLLLILALVVFTVLTGLRVYKYAESPEVRMLSLSLLLALVTYFVHGTLNNFLDSDKLSIPFWAFIAILVALDIYCPKKKVANKEPATSE
jgi:putative inorganic carbon (HCO3(-)) transporter